MEKMNVNRRDKLKLTARVAGLVALDIALVVLAAFAAVLIRLDFNLAALREQYLKELLRVMPLLVAVSLATFIPTRLYQSLWQFAGIDELVHIVCAVFAIVAIEFAAQVLKWIHLPMSFAFMNGTMLMILVCASRFSYRFLRSIYHRRSNRMMQKRTMLIGAGQAAIMVLRELQVSENSQNFVVCIVDDDIQKHGRYLRNVRICGSRYDIVPLAKKYRIEEIVFAIPSATGAERKSILGYCQQTGCKLKMLPSLSQLANGEVTLQKVREVDILDLLGRDSVDVKADEIAGYLTDKVVLVTGGGGSIGSELCRQIAKHTPKTLIIFDIYENNAYDIQQELWRAFPALHLVTLIGSVRDVDRVNRIFEEYRPQIVFHAAAHKHVPLMEDSPNEAIKNNVFGTYHVAKAAAAYQAQAFVLISTDKAVNPTNIMGASKRICEMIVQTMASRTKTRFAAVRFGNVLGSNGSVIPLFKKQIAEGGPVTVTHPDIIRYFMTIPEAVSLVLQAGVYANSGEIFVLDMGEPVRIADLAENLIRLSGFEPNVDIEIRYTGLRPGEKLYEEMLMREEGMRSTANHLIHIGRPLDIDSAVFFEQLSRLEAACEQNLPDIRRLVEQIVSTYHPAVPAAT